MELFKRNEQRHKGQVKFLAVLLFIFQLAELHAFTLVSDSNPPARFPDSEITIHVSSADTCGGGANLSTDDIRTAVQDAIDLYWNKVATSSLKLTLGDNRSISTNGLTTSAAIHAVVPTNTILVGCNDDIAAFVGGSVGGVGSISASSNNASATGYVILNGHADSTLRNFGKIELATLLGHELGHAFGLGHSEAHVALMHYNISLKTQTALAVDDMDAITYLYPNEIDLGDMFAIGDLFMTSLGCSDAQASLGPRSWANTYPKQFILFMAVAFSLGFLSIYLFKVLTQRIRKRRSYF